MDQADDYWWDRLYGAAEGDPGEPGRPSSGTVDERFDEAAAMLSGPPAPRVAAAPPPVLPSDALDVQVREVQGLLAPAPRASRPVRPPIPDAPTPSAPAAVRPAPPVPAPAPRPAPAVQPPPAATRPTARSAGGAPAAPAATRPAAPAPRTPTTERPTAPACDDAAPAATTAAPVRPAPPAPRPAPPAPEDDAPAAGRPGPAAVPVRPAPAEERPTARPAGEAPAAPAPAPRAPAAPRPAAPAPRTPTTERPTAPAPGDAPAPAGERPTARPAGDAAAPAPRAPGTPPPAAAEEDAPPPARTAPPSPPAAAQRMPAEERAAAPARGGEAPPPGRPAPPAAEHPAPPAAPANPADEPSTPPPPEAVHDEPRAVPYVGDRPPTYEAEPGALPGGRTTAVPDLAMIGPDTVLDGCRYGGLTVRAASVRGDSPRYRGDPRRDALLLTRLGEGDRAVLLAAVAGGLRSSPVSFLAARDAVALLAADLERNRAAILADLRRLSAGGWDRDDGSPAPGDPYHSPGQISAGLQRLVHRTARALDRAARGRALDPAEYATSVRCLLVPVRPDCRARLFFGVGGGALLRLRDGAWQDLEPPHPLPGTAGPGEPGMLPQSPSAFRFRAVRARPGDALLVAAPGMAGPLGEPAVAGHLAGQWSPGPERPGPPGLAEFLRQSQIRMKGHADDRTLAVLWEDPDDRDADPQRAAPE